MCSSCDKTVSKQDIIDGLSEHILAALSILNGEQTDPGGDVDRSEQFMEDLKIRIAALRDIRTKLEHVFSGTEVK